MLIQTETPLVSVVIPCYQQAHFLPKSIESALAQTHPCVEIVVVDDGSPDNTAEIVARYPEVRSVRQENSGISLARNAGFGISRGKYVIFLDADDRLLPEAAQAHLRCFAEHPEAGFVVGDIDQISSDGSYSYSPRWPVLEANFYEELLKVNHVANTIAVMFRRSVVESIGGFQKSCTPAEDYEILLRTARSFPSAHHQTVVAQYRRHTTNTSRRGATMLRATHYVMRLQDPWVKGNTSLEAARKKGERYWQDHFGAVSIKEIYIHLRHGRIMSAFRACVTLFWHLRLRVAFLPWKHRKRAFKSAARLLGCGLQYSDRKPER